MRILIVSQYFWPETFIINDLVRGLKSRGHELTILTGMPNYPAGHFFAGYGFLSPVEETYHGSRVIRVPLIPRGGARGWRLAMNYLSFVLSASLLGPFRCREQFDLIFVYEPSPVTVCLPAIVLKRLKGIPIMFWVQDLWPESLVATGAVHSERILRQVGAMVRFIYRRCDRILVQSEGFIPKVRAAGTDPDRVRYFPNWAEPLYRPVALEKEAPERQGIPEGFRLMFAGNLGAAQSLETIVSAADRLRDRADIHWLILGDGRRMDWLRNEVKKRHLTERVHLLGRKPPESMPRYFALADALLVTLRRNPAFALTIPSKIQSYLACSRPVLAALDGEGARVVESSGGGFAVGAEDEVGLAEAVIRLYSMSESERAAMGARGRSYFERHFEREMLLDQLEEWLLETAGERSCGS